MEFYDAYKTFEELDEKTLSVILLTMRNDCNGLGRNNEISAKG